MTLFVVEGVDGVGKTTFINVLKYLIEKTWPEKEVSLYRPSDEPTNRARIRELVSGEHGDYQSVKAELDALFLDSVQRLLSKSIVPDLKKGKVVIIDRFIYSSIVYSGNEYSEMLTYILNQLREYEQHIIHISSKTSLHVTSQDIIEESTKNERDRLEESYYRLFDMLERAYQDNDALTIHHYENERGEVTNKIQRMNEYIHNTILKIDTQQHLMLSE